VAKGRLSFEYEVDDKADSVTAWGGLPLVAEVLAALGVDDSVRRNVHLRKGHREFDAASLVKAAVLMMAAGGDCLDDINILREDTALCRLLGSRLPSAETLREFLYGFHEDVLVEIAQEEAKQAGLLSYIPEESERLRGLAVVMTDFIQAAARRWPQETATIDIDATLQESHKREAKTHYQGGRGYQPTVATWVEADLVVADQFRDGNVPAHMDALRVLKHAFAALPSSVKHRLMRGDSALCTSEVLGWLCSEKIEFAVGGETSKAFRASCAAVPASDWVKVEDRTDSELHVADVPALTGMMQQLPVRVIAVRVTPRQTTLFGEADAPTYFSIVTNRTLPAETVARWYWQKGGTIEHVHAVVKNELGGGTLPCGRFGANAAWFRLVLLTYNVLRVVRHTGPDDLKNARPKRLRLNLLALPTVVARHARQLIARVANRLKRGAALLASRNALWALEPA
jgi:hypothetical protein